MAKKTLSLILAALLVAQVLVSCGNDSDGGNTTTPTEISGATTEETIPDEPNKKNGLWYADYLPEKDYEGYTFRVLTMDQFPTDVTEEDGDIVNDAYYKRNSIIESRYNINFEQTSYMNYWETTEAFKKSALAQSDDFDLCRLIQRDAFAVALEGLAATPDMLPYIDMTKPWYIQYLNEALTIDGQAILAYSDECEDAMTGVLSVFFNKKILDDLGLESPYTLVRNGTWTYDKMFEYAGKAVSDLNGDGEFKFNEDRFGFIDEVDMFMPSIWIGSNVMTVGKDADDIPYFNALGNERFYEIVKDVNTFVNTKGNFLNTFKAIATAEESRIKGRASFSYGYSLFHMAGFGKCLELREMKNDFGMVPVPKYDTEQTEYLSRIIDAWTNVALSCATDLERTSIILEALAVESKNYVIPAIYENAITQKGIRDEDSLEMLEIIQKNRTLDLGDTVWQADIRNKYYEMVMANKDNVASQTEKIVKKADKIISDALEQVEALKSRG